MRQAIILGRSCLRNGLCRGPPCVSHLSRLRHIHFRLQAHTPRKALQRINYPSAVLLALSPAAFVQLSEEGRDNGESSEIHMLEASRQELEEELPDDVRGLRRFWLQLEWAFDAYIFEPIATGVRFLHLVVIFIPVILTTPVALVGSRNEHRDNERSGTLWWYRFLVRAMELAGPAFIKVRECDISPRIAANVCAAGAVGCLTARYIPIPDVCRHVFAPLECSSPLASGNEKNHYECI